MPKKQPPGRAAATPRKAKALSKAERTRASIRASANDLFLRHGVDATTVDAIVARAGVSKGTFYLHFARKEDLLLEYGAQRLRRVQEMIPELIRKRTFREAMTAIVDEVVRGKTWGRELTGRALLEMGMSAERLSVEEPAELILPLLQMGRARGEIRDDIPEKALAQFVLRSILGALRDWGLGHDDLDREHALDYALTLVFDAVAKRDPPD